MTVLKKPLALLIAAMGVTFWMARALMSDAWAAGQIGSAIGENALPGLMALIAAVFLWRDRRDR